MKKYTLMNKNKKVFDFIHDENDMYVGQFFLTKPFEEYEVSQLSLVENLDWLDISMLEDFSNDVKNILSLNKFLSEERINKIVDQVNKRIDIIRKLKENLLNL